MATEKPPRTRRRLGLAFVYVLIVVALLGWTYQRYARALPVLQPTATYAYASTTKTAELTWPSYGQAAIGATNAGVLATNGAQKPTPTASIAKVITALTILKHKPLKPGETGPTITLTAADVAIYQSYIAKNGSVATVTAGEQLTEYQALQTMLLPSANNMADSLAIWAFGSMDAYISAANQMISELGLRDTYAADASGFSPQTVSTAQDLVKLGTVAIQEPAIAAVVAQTSATVPPANTVVSTNKLLGTDGINGIKTGNTNEAGDCLLFSAVYTPDGGSKITIVGVILGAPDRPRVFADTIKLLDSTKKGFSSVTIAKAGDTVGHYSSPWGGSVDAVAEQDVKIIAWNGQPLTPKLQLEPIGDIRKGQTTVGSLNVESLTAKASSPVVIKTLIAPPDWKWRVFH